MHTEKAPQTERPIENPTEWGEFRCRNCQKVLFFATNAVLRGGLTRDQRIEVKCRRCHTKNHLMGR